MKKKIFLIFHLPGPKRTCLSVPDIVPVTFIENHWSLIPIRIPKPDLLTRLNPDPIRIRNPVLNYNSFDCCAELSRALPELEADPPAAELPGRQQQDPHVR
jgi:hypothetical protein